MPSPPRGGNCANPTVRGELICGLVCYATAVIGILLVCTAMVITGQDFMGCTVFTCPTLGQMTRECGVYSMWPVSHVVLYALLGYVAPSWWWLWVLLGIVWEGVEQCVGYTLTQLNVPMPTVEANGVQYGGCRWNEWVKGMRSDIVFNTVGLIFGSLLS